MIVKRKITPIALSVHLDSENAIYGEGATHVRLQDDAGGGFVELEQSYDGCKPGLIKLDFEEIEWIAKAISMLKEGANESE